MVRQRMWGKKNELKKYTKNLINNPHDNKIRESLYMKKKNLKNLISTKKNTYKEDILKQLSSKGDQKQYWKLVYKLTNKKDKEQSYVSYKILLKHF